MPIYKPTFIFQKVDQYTGGKLYRESKYDIKGSEGNIMQSNIQMECPGAETSKGCAICQIRTA